MLNINSHVISSSGLSRPIVKDVNQLIHLTSAVSAYYASDTLSVLARQLSEAALRASVREKAMTAAQLSHHLASLERQLAGEKYPHQEELRDAHKPEVQASASRARQTTESGNNRGANPFGKMPEDQLTLIAYDEGPAFTLSERRAAWQALQTLSRTPYQVSLASTAIKNDEGHQILVSRVFNGKEPALSTVAETGHSEKTPDAQYLTRQDRTLLSHVYAWAQGQGTDLRYVDDLASELGVYRHYDDGRSLGNIEKNARYDGSGRELSVSFTPQNALLAKRMLGSLASSNTLLDKGFLRFELDPRYMPGRDGCDLGFLEQVVNRFSTNGSKDSELNNHLATYPEIRAKTKILEWSKETRRTAYGEPHAISVNGVWTITPKGKAAGYVLNKATGELEQIKPEPKPAEKKTGHFLDGFFDKPGVKRLLPTPLMQLLMKYKLQGRIRQR